MVCLSKREMGVIAPRRAPGTGAGRFRCACAMSSGAGGLKWIELVGQLTRASNALTVASASFGWACTCAIHWEQHTQNRRDSSHPTPHAHAKMPGSSGRSSQARARGQPRISHLHSYPPRSAQPHGALRMRMGPCGGRCRSLCLREPCQRRQSVSGFNH